MWSTPSRASEPSQLLWTYSGLPSTVRPPLPGRPTMPNFVASVTSSRRLAMARPTTSSLV
jgi:hypothetical protein